MKSQNKKVINATIVSQDNLQFKSKLELFTYNKLLESNLPINYETTTFELLPKFYYKTTSLEGYTKKKKYFFGQARELVRVTTYTPDFTNLKKLNGKLQGWVIEVKGHKTPIFKLKWKLFKYLMLNHNVSLYQPKNQKEVVMCIENIKNLNYEF